MRAIRVAKAVIIVGLPVVMGCVEPQAELATLERPERSAEMDAFEVFVGAWDFEAEMLELEGADRMWKGMAEWRYTLDGRALAGSMSLRNPKAPFQTQGLWTYDPAKETYIWAMFNDWGYPLMGEAEYKADKQTWVMDYTGTGLDGSDSYGRYEIRVVNEDDLRWRMREWADKTRLVKKSEMRGKYTRRK